MPNDYSDKIKAARDAGYNDDEIAAFIGKSDPKMAEALQSGYSGSEILKHLESQPDVQPEQPKSVWERLKEGFSGLEKVPQTVTEGQLANAPRFTVPGGSSTPLKAGIDEAGAAANFGLRPSPGMVTPNMMGVAGDVAGGLKEGTAILSRTTENELRPTIKVAAHVGPMLVGAEKAGSLGGLIGTTMGDKVEALLDKTLPKRSGVISPEEAADILKERLQRAGAYAEMNKDIAAGQQQRAGAQAEMQSDIAAGQQERAAAQSQMESDINDARQNRAANRNEMYDSLAAARNRRGNPRVTNTPAERVGGASGVSRTGSAGDLTQWKADDLWEGYMKNRGTPEANAMAAELQRRGLVKSPAGSFRPNAPAGRNQMYPEISNLDAGVGTPEAFKSPDWLEGINQMRQSVSKATAEGAEPNVTDAMNRVIEETKDRLVNAPAGRAAAQPTISTDSMGTKWAEGSGGVRVSIPKRIPDSGVMEYARTKLAEQVAMQAKIKGSY